MIGIGPFIHGRDEHSKCRKTLAAVVITLNEVCLLGEKLRVQVGLTGNVKPVASNEVN